MARQRKTPIPEGFKPEYPDGWNDFIDTKFAELYAKAETEEFEVYELQYASNGAPAPFNLIIGKFGPVWQDRNNRGRFISFENDDDILAHGFKLAVVKRWMTVDLVHSADNRLGLKIKRAQ